MKVKSHLLRRYHGTNMKVWRVIKVMEYLKLIFVMFVLIRKLIESHNNDDM